ncbi:MAG: malate dehydrogenase, partial [Flavobacteriaceae bacterium]
GEYGLENLCIGVPCIIGAKGVESIVDLQLNEKEQALLNESAEKVKAMNAALKEVL